ncbi:MAG: hypothetical protein OCD02_17180 [Spirochaetaceae bacterium]
MKDFIERSLNACTISKSKQFENLQTLYLVQSSFSLITDNMISIGLYITENAINIQFNMSDILKGDIEVIEDIITEFDALQIGPYPQNIIKEMNMDFDFKKISYIYIK